MSVMKPRLNRTRKVVYTDQEREKQKKMNLINMPDAEFSYLMQDLTEIITLYNKQFFLLVDKIIFNASVPQGKLNSP